MMAGIKIPAIDHAILFVALDLAGPSSAPAEESSPTATTKLNTAMTAKTTQMIVIIVLAIPFAISFSPSAKPNGANAIGAASVAAASVNDTALCFSSHFSVLFSTSSQHHRLFYNFFRTHFFFLSSLFVKPKWLHLYYAIFS